MVESRNVKGLVRNHKLAQVASSDAWKLCFVNFLSYKLKREDKKLVEIDRFLPSSHICPECLTQQPKMNLSVREWTCINKSCNAVHDRDEAYIPLYFNNKQQQQRTCPHVRKTKVMQHPAKLETHSKR